MPQDPESEAELRNLAAVPYQIISPANNKSIIGIYQDSMLGCYQFTREKEYSRGSINVKEGIRFEPRDAMNLLMMFDGVNENKLLDALPCFICKKMIINSGIKNFIYMDDKGKVKKLDIEKSWTSQWRRKDMLEDVKKYNAGKYQKLKKVERKLRTKNKEINGKR